MGFKKTDKLYPTQLQHKNGIIDPPSPKLLERFLWGTSTKAPAEMSGTKLFFDLKNHERVNMSTGEFMQSMLDNNADPDSPDGPAYAYACPDGKIRTVNLMKDEKGEFYFHLGDVVTPVKYAHSLSEMTSEDYQKGIKEWTQFGKVLNDRIKFDEPLGYGNNPKLAQYKWGMEATVTEVYGEVDELPKEKTEEMVKAEAEQKAIVDSQPERERILEAERQAEIARREQEKREVEELARIGEELRREEEQRRTEEQHKTDEARRKEEQERWAEEQRKAIAEEKQRRAEERALKQRIQEENKLRQQQEALESLRKAEALREQRAKEASARLAEQRKNGPQKVEDTLEAPEQTTQYPTQKMDKCFRATGDTLLGDIDAKLWGGMELAKQKGAVLFDLNKNANVTKAKNAIYDLVNAAEKTNLAVMCPDGKPRKMEAVRDEAGRDYFRLSDEPLQGPPKPGLLKRFVNLFKSVKDPDVQSWNEWDKFVSDGKSRARQVDKSKGLDWGSQIDGYKFDDYFKKQDERKNQAAERKEYEAEKKHHEMEKYVQERQTLLDRGLAGEFGRTIQTYANTIVDGQKVMHSLEYHGPENRRKIGQLIAEDMETAARDFVKASVGLQLASQVANPKALFDSEKGQRGFQQQISDYMITHRMDRMMADCTENMGRGIAENMVDLAHQMVNERDKELENTKDPVNDDLSKDDDGPDDELDFDDDSPSIDEGPSLE